MGTQLLRDSMVHQEIFRLTCSLEQIGIKPYCLVSDINQGIIDPKGTETRQFFCHMFVMKKKKNLLPLLKME